MFKIRLGNIGVEMFFFISFELQVHGNGGGRDVEEECLYELEYRYLEFDIWNFQGPPV